MPLGRLQLFRTLLATAFIAGLAGGVLASVTQLAGLVPLIKQAEVYETGAKNKASEGPNSVATHSSAGAGEDEHHAAGAHQHEWEPHGIERTLYTVLANVVIGVGFACLLVGAIAVRALVSKRPVNVRLGLWWGVAGFVVFSLSPALGLPPELPGAPEAPLLPRQIWWGGTTISTAAGLACLVFPRGIWPRVLGVGLLLLPHVVGAPHVSGSGAVPHALTTEYIWVSIASAGLFWLLLGGLSGWLLARLGFSPRNV